jgi:hypothetical protein
MDLGAGDVYPTTVKEGEGVDVPSRKVTMHNVTLLGGKIIKILHPMSIKNTHNT